MFSQHRTSIPELKSTCSFKKLQNGMNNSVIHCMSKFQNFGSTDIDCGHHMSQDPVSVEHCDLHVVDSERK